MNEREIEKMSENNLVEFIDSLIECGLVLIPCREIKVIRAGDAGKGVEIEVDGGHIYIDSNTTYEKFKEKLANKKTVLLTSRKFTSVSLLSSDESLKEGKVPNIPNKLPLSPLSEDYNEAGRVPSPFTAPVQEVKSPARIERVMIPIDNPALGSAEGTLPHTDIINRKSIVITNNLDQVLGTGHVDSNGTIIGSNVTGIVFSSGSYRLVFKEYSEKEAYISYDVQEEE